MNTLNGDFLILNTHSGDLQSIEIEEVNQYKN